MKAFCKWLLLILLSATIAMGQEFPVWLKDANVPPPPPEMISDESGLFASRPEALEKMRQAVKKLSEERGFKIYVIIKSIAIEGAPAQLAGQYQEAWLPNGDGLVLVYEANNKAIGLWRGYHEDVASPEQRWLIPSHEIMKILTEMKPVKFDLGSDQIIEEMTLDLASRCSAYFESLDAPVPKGRNFRLIGLVAAATGLGVGIFVLLSLLLKRTGSGKDARFLFPETDLPERLKAPYGGGNVSVRQFR